MKKPVGPNLDFGTGNFTSLVALENSPFAQMIILVKQGRRRRACEVDEGITKVGHLPIKPKFPWTNKRLLTLMEEKNSIGLEQN